MGHKKHKKICLLCVEEFENAGSGNCPYCGSDRWNFIDENGGRRIPYMDALEAKPGPGGKVVFLKPRGHGRSHKLKKIFGWRQHGN